ncbi:uncharacterized protein LOC132946925 isoform X2 [Metopolophium dirhodum]|uniref:uncharacterized protein LOC132946925 isoform X2 n=1 Tax=Metopolophium dirhodum TaxID=44670 RepID=UPI0029901492|nr:uncharacterized protein LOC132946925 isoform X2 [Metopolophium dirhodum]
MGARTNSNVDMRTYKSKLGQRRYINYSSEALDEALLKVVNGELSLRKASKQYNIPYGTINNKFHGVHIRKMVDKQH